MPIISSIGASSKTGFAPRGLPVYYSNLFVKAQTDYISMPASANLAPGTSAFTLEFFVYLNTFTYQSIYSTGFSASASTGFEVTIDSSGFCNLVKYSTGGTLSLFVSTTAVSAGWNYVVLTRRSTASSDSQWFINGAAANTGTISNDFSAPSTLTTNIGARRSTLTTPADAYISNLRLRIGVGVSSVTVPGNPLQPDANTRLLTCQSSTIIDNAPSPNTLTNNGVTVSTFNPFL
jgi:hypothetical protein